MNNTTKTRTLIIAAILVTTLVVGTFAATTTTQSAFAYEKKDGNNNNGNTVTIQKCRQDGIQSGFDNSFEQECQNLICTHPGNNATCSREGVISAPTTGTLLVNKICLACVEIPFPIQITGNNPQPSTFILTPGSSQLVTLGTGAFSVTETDTFHCCFTTFSGNCMQTFPFSKEATGTISAGQHLSCTITNVPNR